MGSRTNANILGRVRCGARHPRIDHDHIGAVELLTFENVLQRYRMRFGGIPATETNTEKRKARYQANSPEVQTFYRVNRYPAK